MFASLIFLIIFHFRRTADVRSVGYSELFSLSREDVLAAMKDYPEAQEILQSLGRKRLAEAQRVARMARHRPPPSPGGHDSSDNSTGKRIVSRLKSDVKGLKSVLRKSRRGPNKGEDGMELQPLTSKIPQLRRQTRIDDSQDANAPASDTGPISPLGAGLPLLSRLRLLKEKQDREEKNKLTEIGSHQSHQNQHHPIRQSSFHQHHHHPSQAPDTPTSGSSSGGTLPLLSRLWGKAKVQPPVPEQESLVEMHRVKEPLLAPSESVIPEEPEGSSLAEQDSDEEHEDEQKDSVGEIQSVVTQKPVKQVMMMFYNCWKN